MRNLRLPVSNLEVEEKVKQLIQPYTPAFQASDGWIRRFFRRNNFTLRAKTLLSQKLPEKLEEKMTMFLVEVQQTRRSGRYPAALIDNMDETPVYFDLVPNRTVDTVGAKSCNVCSTGSEKGISL